MFDKEFTDNVEAMFQRRDEREIEKIKGKQTFRKRFEGVIVFKCQLCGQLAQPYPGDMVDNIEDFLEKMEDYDLSPRVHHCNEKYSMHETKGSAVYVGIVKREN